MVGWRGCRVSGPWVGCSGCQVAMAAVWNKSKGARGAGRGGRVLPGAFLTSCAPPQPPCPTVAGNGKETAFCGCDHISWRLCSNPDFPSTPEHLSEHFSSRLALGKHTQVPRARETPEPSVALPCHPCQAAPSSSSAPEPPEVLHLPPEESDTLASAPSIPPTLPLTASGTRSWGAGKQGAPVHG